MRNRLWIILCACALGLGFTLTPAQALETRFQSFTLLCDATGRTVIFNATNMGTSVNRFIVGAGISIVEPRSGINFFRLLAVPGDPTKIVLVMGRNEISKDLIFTSFMQVTSNTAGNIPMQLVGNCRGGGTLRGFVTVYFFS